MKWGKLSKRDHLKGLSCSNVMMWNLVYANLVINKMLFRTIFFLSQSKQLVRCSLVYHTQPPSGTASLTIRHVPSSTII